MIDVFEYENRTVFVHCIDGREYRGLVKWCARAEDVDEAADLLNVEGIGILANEIKTISIVN